MCYTCQINDRLKNNREVQSEVICAEEDGRNFLKELERACLKELEFRLNLVKKKSEVSDKWLLFTPTNAYSLILHLEFTRH